MAPDRTECRAFGIVPNANLHALANVLRGMCVHVRETKVLEVVLTIPLQGGANSTQLRLSRPVTSAKASSPAQQPERWLVQHEGLPMRGVSVAGLPAAVREITDSSCLTANTPEFFIALGARQEYVLEKKGNEYTCMHEGYELQVDVINVWTHMGPLGAPTKTLPGGKWVVDLRVRVPDGTHAAACQAIGSFAAKLTPLVSLQPALLPI